jgi:hypothetical protein
MQTLGNMELLKLPKTAFFCSSKVPASVVLKCYGWAMEQRENNTCIISGFHSRKEKQETAKMLKINKIKAYAKTMVRTII